MLTGPRSDESGFSLIELLVVMSLGLVIMAAVFGTVLALTRVSQQSVDENVTQDINRVGLERLTRFVRQATYPQGGSQTNSAIFERAEDGYILFFADVDDDGVSERIRFRLVGDEILQTVMECGDPANCTYATLASTPEAFVIDGVRNDVLAGGSCDDFAADVPLFRYFERSSDGELTPAATPVSPALYGRISAVEITLVVDVTQGAGAGCQELSSLIHLRNWRG